MKHKSLFVAQSGGPTSVINSTLAGIITEARNLPEVDHIYGLLHGLEGALRGEIIDLNGLNEEDIKELRRTPGAFLGGSRYKLREGDLDNIAQFLKGESCQYFLFIGGNGTMETCLRLKETFRQKKIHIEVVGVPKTVDNDIEVTDHVPGYGSAARYIALAVRDQTLDLEAMQRFEQVRIIETMGRTVGWLTAASFLAMGATTTINPLFIPEIPIDEEEIISHIKRAYQQQGYVVAVVSEGLCNKKGEPMGKKPFMNMEEEACRITRTGVANYLAQKVSEQLNLRARPQILGMNQRSFANCISRVDEEEAYLVGRAAVRLAVRDGGGQMITLVRKNDVSETSFTPLELVAGVERPLPLNYYDNVNKKVTREFEKWLKPLIGDLGSVLTKEKLKLMKVSLTGKRQPQ